MEIAESNCDVPVKLTTQALESGTGVPTKSTNVKSTAIVKYSAVHTPPQFCRLRSNTDLNLPPDNWLRESDRCRALKGYLASTITDSPMLTSLHMANEFPDCVGEVDVVSDAENIKKLLKMPYSKSQVSLMVHRIGKTLFLDEFDINMYLLRAAKKEWEWLRSFYLDHVLQSLGIHQKEKNLFRKNRSRDYLHSKSMLSKFLYYSVEDSSAEGATSPNHSNSTTTASDDGCGFKLPAMKSSPQTECIPDLDDECPEEGSNMSHNFQRNVIWNFEDIRMLVGTDMPIFGAGTHPCVSLRLRDITKPINILTGLDYWLDNLMCNVPEVMMCYHLDGIVQKYELIKTEDLPALENCLFSPKVIKDIAQNVLSFLKSNATKAGHTYWLFKAKDDEVVKLYDLTTLCSEGMDNEERNPVTMPLAMLLYRLARNMKASGPKTSQRGTIAVLLQSCLALLDEKKHPQVVTSSHYLLSDLYVPDTLDLLSPNLSPSDTDDDTSDNDFDDEQSDDSPPTAVTSTVEIKTLCLPDKLHNQQDTSSDRKACHRFLVGTLEQRCLAALQHSQDGLKCIETDKDPAEECSGQDHSSFEDAPLTFRAASVEPKEEVQARAMPFKPIPLHYKPLNEQKSSKDLSLTPKSQYRWPWKHMYTKLLLQKATVSAYIVSYCLCSKNEIGTALRFTRLALRCYDALKSLACNEPEPRNGSLSSCILGVAGDLHLLLVQHSTRIDEFCDQHENFPHFTDLDSRVQAMTTNRQSLSYEWASDIHKRIEDNLKCSIRCYETALETAVTREDNVKLRKRLGNVKNEMGVFYLNQAHNMYNETGELTPALENLWKLSLDSLEAGVMHFEGMEDDINTALLNSNLGRLMRTRAFCYAPPKDVIKEFSVKEGSFYEKAISYYRKSLRILDDSPKRSAIRESISWELSTTYFNMAMLLQDFAPLSRKTPEEVEKEICELMHKALMCINVDTPSAHQPIYQYRAATIYHRLGSLYHHSFRHVAKDEVRKKQQRTLADRHLTKAADLFKLLEDVNEFMRVHLERIGLIECQAKNAAGCAAKAKFSRRVLGLVFEAVPVLTHLAEKVEQENATHYTSSPTAPGSTVASGASAEADAHADLLLLLQQRLQFALLNLVKAFSGKSPSQKDHQTDHHLSPACKLMYSVALKLPTQFESRTDVDKLIQSILEIQDTYNRLFEIG